jgi:ketosteroid isomerase-like protein
MSRENVELVYDATDAFNREDVDAFVALASPDVEWEDAIFWSGVTRTYRGRAELRDWFQQVREPWESIHCEVEEIAEADDRVFFDLLINARGEESGVEAPGLRVWCVVWIANGEVTRRRVFRDRAEALEAAALQE